MELAVLCIDLNYKLAENLQSLTRDQINFLMASLKIRGESTEAAQFAEEGITKIIFRED